MELLLTLYWKCVFFSEKLASDEDHRCTRWYQFLKLLSFVSCNPDPLISGESKSPSTGGSKEEEGTSGICTCYTAVSTPLHVCAYFYDYFFPIWPLWLWHSLCLLQHVHATKCDDYFLHLPHCYNNPAPWKQTQQSKRQLHPGYSMYNHTLLCHHYCTYSTSPSPFNLPD